jgi:hypothetical protein
MKKRNITIAIVAVLVIAAVAYFYKRQTPLQKAQKALADCLKRNENNQTLVAVCVAEQEAVNKAAVNNLTL